MAAEGLAPSALARQRRPVAFVDLVYAGRTYENLFRQIRDWVSSESAPWEAVRSRLRFIGITEREKTSPNTWRWQQHAQWTAELPPRCITNVSMQPASGACSATGSRKSSRHSTGAAGLIQQSPSPSAMTEHAPPWPRR